MVQYPIHLSLKRFDGDLLRLRVDAPVLDGGPSFLLRVDLGHSAHLLGDLNTLLHSLEVRYQLGHVSTDLQCDTNEKNQQGNQKPTFWGSSSHSSTGLATTAALTLFSQAWHWNKHLESRITILSLFTMHTCFSAHPLGAQSVLGSSLQAVSGVVLFTLTWQSIMMEDYGFTITQRSPAPLYTSQQATCRTSPWSSILDTWII